MNKFFSYPAYSITACLATLNLNLLINATSWETLLTKQKSHLTTSEFQLLNAQQTAFAAGNAPKITDSRVKHIPIVECNEPLVNLSAMNNPRISVMTDEQAVQAYQGLGEVDPRAPNHGHMRQSVYVALARMINELDTLATHFGYKSGELEIHLFEGLRDLATQKAVFYKTMDELRLKHPLLTEEELYTETCTWVSPYKNNVPVHSTGAAIDIHLFNKTTGDYCDMGPFNQSGTKTPTFSQDENLTLTQKNNRLLLLIAATRARLTNYVYEFWHFSYGDRYAAYWRVADASLRSACYGAV